MISLMYAHAVLMCCACLLLLSGALIARLAKQKKWWLATHRSVGITGTLVMAAGLCSMLLQVYLAGRPHSAIPHSYVGFIVTGLGILTPIFGQLQLTVSSARPKIRRLHIWFGRSTILLMIVNIIIGLSLIGIL